MNYAEFKEALKDALQTRFLGRAEVYFQSVKKTNDTAKEAVVLWKNQKEPCPTIYLEELYQGYQQTGGFEKYVEMIVQICENPLFSVKEQIPKKWEEVKHRLQMRVINKNWNTELLKQVPYKEYLDFAVVFYILVKEEQEMIASVLVNWEQMETWKVGLEGLWKTALRNLKKESFRVESVMEFVRKKLLREMADPGMAELLTKQVEAGEIEACLAGLEQLHVVKNPSESYGGRAILREDLLREFAQEQGGDFYILPCSVHELLLLKDTGRVTAEELKKMVCEINHGFGMVEPEARLSDSVYYYNKETDRVEIVA